MFQSILELLSSILESTLEFIYRNNCFSSPRVCAIKTSSDIIYPVIKLTDLVMFHAIYQGLAFVYLSPCANHKINRTNDVVLSVIH